MAFTCCTCSKRFSQKQNLTRHKKTVSCTTKSTTSKIICCERECDEIFQSHKYYVEHLCSIHNKDIRLEEMRFESKVDFLLWKYKIERATLSKYVKESKTNILKNDVKKTFLVCHRSNAYRSNVYNHRQRALKFQGSCKIGSTCPSRIEISEYKDLTLAVKFWPVHCGHTNDIEHTTLDKQTREELADKLRSGVTFDHILDEARNGEYIRLMCLQRKDLHNIASTNKIGCITKPCDCFQCLCSGNSSQCSCIINSSNIEMEDIISLEKRTVDSTSDLINKILESKIIALLDVVQNVKTEICGSTAVEIQEKIDSALALLGSGCQSESSRTNENPEINVMHKINSRGNVMSTKRQTLVKRHLKNTTVEGLKSDVLQISHVQSNNDNDVAKMLNVNAGNDYLKNENKQIFYVHEDNDGLKSDQHQILYVTMNNEDLDSDNQQILYVCADNEHLKSDEQILYVNTDNGNCISDEQILQVNMDNDHLKIDKQFLYDYSANDHMSSDKQNCYVHTDDHSYFNSTLLL